jgi:hypothetical protein
MHGLRLPLLPLVVLAVAPATARGQVYERIDVDNLGQPGNAGGGAGEIAHDGRLVVFVSDATNFGGPDVAGTPDVFVRDRQLMTTTRITASLNPAGPDKYQFPRISGDGTKIGFLFGGANPQVSTYRSFVHVLATNTTTEIVVPGLQDVRLDALNRDGSFAVLSARTSTNPALQVYRLNLASGALVLCSKDANGNPVGGRNGDIDDAGTHVAFESASAQLVPNDTNGTPDVFVLDIPGNIMLRASVSSEGGQSNGFTILPSISGDGRFVTMESTATNLALGDTNLFADIYLRDLRLEVTSILSLSTQQVALARGAEGRSFLSADASSVAFSSREPIQPGDSLSLDAFLRDIEVGVLLPSSPGDALLFADSQAMGVTRDGREVLLFSQQQAVVAPFTGPGVFVARFGPRCSSSGYCTSLPNSTGEAASIGAQGDASLQLNNLVISAVGLPDTANSMLVSGTAAIDPGTPFGNGLLCVGGTLIRHGIHVANGGVILDAQDMQSPEYMGVQPGDTRYYQVIYRDPPAGGALFNTTDAVAITFCW